MRAGLAFAQRGECLLHHRELRLGLLVAGLGFLLDGGDTLFQALHVGEHQLRLDHLGVGQRIDAVFHVGDVVVLEAAQHVGDGVHLADVRQELVAEPFALGGAAHQSGDVDERQPRRDDLPGFGDGGELVQPFVRNTNLADVRLDGAERIVGGLGRRGLRQRVEEGGFADVRQAHNTAFEAHDCVARRLLEARRASRQAARSRCVAHA